ncbi:GGDEF domain-containing protein [Roseibium sp.]|uniref:GGDEF domain-containing protein n=1 Tax=Roseibium sp. TaxID=1936156 RepID=UPI003D0DCDB5
MLGLKPRWDNGPFLLVCGTLVFVAVSICLNYLLFFSDSLSPFGRNMVLAVALPVLVGAPLLSWVIFLRRQVSALRRHSNYLATHDRLTGLPNGVAFSSLAERRKTLSADKNGSSGAFLIVRAGIPDNGVSQHGVSFGNDAVSLTAAAIVSAVRSTDLVGRIGPDLFAIFLWGATEEEARQVGRRIYEDCGAIQIEPGTASSLDLRVGGILFEGHPDVDYLFREASGQFAGEGGEVTATPYFQKSADFPMTVVRH